MKHKVTEDITDREKIFINPNNGERITKLKGWETIPNSSPHQTGVTKGSFNQESPSGGSTEQQNQEGEKGTPPIEDKKPESLSVEDRLNDIEIILRKQFEVIKILADKQKWNSILQENNGMN